MGQGMLIKSFGFSSGAATKWVYGTAFVGNGVFATLDFAPMVIAVVPCDSGLDNTNSTTYEVFGQVWYRASEDEGLTEGRYTGGDVNIGCSYNAETGELTAKRYKGSSMGNEKFYFVAAGV